MTPFYIFYTLALSSIFLIADISGNSSGKIDSVVKILSGYLANFYLNSSTQIAQTTSVSTSETAIETAVCDQINQYRASRGLSPLKLEERITREARIHSQSMASGKVPFSHDGFSQRVQAIAIPYRSSAENVAYNRGYSDPDARAVEGWLSSSGHLRNIRGNYNLTGVGVAKNAQGVYYFTQIFVLSR